MELPSLPKSFAINTGAFSIVIIFFVISLVGLIVFLPEFFEKPSNIIEEAELNVEFAYVGTAFVGEPWPVNITLNNPTNTPIRNITIRIYSDGNVQGDVITIEGLLPKTTRQFFLKPEIKRTAEVGQAGIQTFVIVPGSQPNQRELQITIEESIIDT